MHDILCFGNSHWHAIRLGYSHLAARRPLEFRVAVFDISMRRYQPWTTSTGAGLAFNPVFLDDVDGFVRDARPLLVLSVLGGSAWVPYGMANGPRPFDFVLPDDPGRSLIEDADIVPYDAIRDLFRPHVRNTCSVLRTIRDSTCLPLFQVSPPPPIGSNARIAAVAGDGIRALYAGQEQYGIPPPHLRYKIWRLYIDSFREACAEWGCNFLEVPAASQDEHGFLREQYWSADVLHANHCYGELVVEQLEAVVRQAERAA